MATRIEQILSLIEEARTAGELGNDQARTASVALQIKSEYEAMLACRLVAQGPDPASLDYLDTGDVSKRIWAAHKNGPGVFEADDPCLLDYLALCAMSQDESQGAGESIRGRFWGFFRSMTRLAYQDEEFKAAAMAELGRRELEKIKGLDYKVAVVGGATMRVYQTDRGFAAAYWGGEDRAAVLGTYNGEPYLAIGAPNWAPALEDQGVKVDKAISPRFGIVEEEAEVARVIEETGLEVE